MACRISIPWTGCTLSVAVVCLIALTGLVQAEMAVQLPVTPGEPPAQALSQACKPGAAALAAESPLPGVAAALARRKTLRILTMGAAPGRIGSHGGTYTDVIKAMLRRALKGIDVEVINRGVSGELAINAAERMRNEVGLEEPDLVLWQVGTNDALAYVPTADFVAIVKEQIEWLKAHKVDVVLVGLQFAPQALRDEHYSQVRDALRKLAAEENVMIVRFFEAMRALDNVAEADLPVAEEFERNEEGYICLAEYVARAITLGIFAKDLPQARPQR